MRVIVATDGSKCSRRAIEECCRIFASAKNAEIKIISVYEILYPVAGESFAVSASFYEDYEVEMKKQAENVAAEAVEILRRSCPENRSEITADAIKGSPARVIVEAAKEWRADLIVVGSHGRGFWGRLTLGSVSDTVIHQAPCSVLVVRGRKES
jgi:nucleotide-binding universal stress UspA family protein